MRRALKYMLSVVDGYKLWDAKRDGWQVETRLDFSRSVAAVEYHSMTTTPRAKLGVATCRVCGKKIEAADDRFMLVGNPGDNLWTAQYWYVHAKPCAERA